MGARETQHPPAPTSVTGRWDELGREMRRVGRGGGHRRQLRAQRASEPILDSGDNLPPPAFPLGHLTDQRAKARPVAGEQPNSRTAEQPPKYYKRKRRKSRPDAMRTHVRVPLLSFHWLSHSRLAPYRLLGDVVSAATTLASGQSKTDFPFFHGLRETKFSGSNDGAKLRLILQEVHRDFWRAV